MKRVDSPIGAFPGYVEISTPLTYQQILLIEECQVNAEKVRDGLRISTAEDIEDIDIEDAARNLSVGIVKHWREIIPAVVGCVSEWHITENMPEQVTVETFPGSPKKPAQDFLSFLWAEIIGIYVGEGAAEVPNG